MSILIHQSRQYFDFGRRMGDMLVGRYLARRARRLLAEGHAPLAIFAHDYIGQEISLKGRFEDEELAALFDFLAPFADRFAAQVALDVGANIGNHSLFFAGRFATVHSFEPNPRTFALLAANAALNPRIVSHRTALGEAPGELSLRFDPANVGEATLRSDLTGRSLVEVTVPVGRLDDLVDPALDIGFVKIDVEGFEASVLRGACRLLSRLPVIAFEQNREAFADGRSEVAEMLSALGYRLCVLQKRDVGGGLSLLHKLSGGIRYDIVEVETLVAGIYPMIVAVSPTDLSLLRSRQA